MLIIHKKKEIFLCIIAVAPFTGAWIEISALDFDTSVFRVAPFTGAWIEIHNDNLEKIGSDVAPFTGAWIEITVLKSILKNALSLPLRERGLKYCSNIQFYLILDVAPFTGAWIEIWKVT